MDRITTINQADVDRHRAALQQGFYAQYEKPCPGSRLQNDDDVLWNNFAAVRVLWGHDDPGFFFGYCPEYFGDSAVPFSVAHVSDRAPADPEEVPMPVIVDQVDDSSPSDDGDDGDDGDGDDGDDGGSELG